jgi:hypothetical protein
MLIFVTFALTNLVWFIRTFLILKTTWYSTLLLASMCNCLYLHLHVFVKLMVILVTEHLLYFFNWCLWVNNAMCINIFVFIITGIIVVLIFIRSMTNSICACGCALNIIFGLINLVWFIRTFPILRLTWYSTLLLAGMYICLYLHLHIFAKLMIIFVHIIINKMLLHLCPKCNRTIDMPHSQGVYTVVFTECKECASGILMGEPLRVL